MTSALKAARAHLKPFGVTIRETEASCPMSREYRVNLVNGSESTAYYTSDLTDAICTGEVMAESRGTK